MKKAFFFLICAIMIGGVAAATEAAPLVEEKSIGVEVMLSEAPVAIPDFAGPIAVAFDVEGTEITELGELEAILGARIIRDDPGESPAYSRGETDDYNGRKSSRHSHEETENSGTTIGQFAAACVSGFLEMHFETLYKSNNYINLVKNITVNELALIKDVYSKITTNTGSIKQNRDAGKAFEATMASLFEKAGFVVRKGQAKTTALGVRVVDLEIQDSKGKKLFYVECKLNDSDYKPSQRAKDNLMRLIGDRLNSTPTPTVVVRGGRNRGDD
jgi:hypothetical protein